MAHRRVPAGDETTVLIAPPLRPARPPQRGPLFTVSAFAVAYVAYTGAAGLSSKLPHPPAPLALCLVLAICVGLVLAAYTTLARQQRQTDDDVRWYAYTSSLRLAAVERSQAAIAKATAQVPTITREWTREVTDTAFADGWVACAETPPSARRSLHAPNPRFRGVATPRYRQLSP